MQVLRQRAPLEGEVKGEIEAEAGMPREDDRIQRLDVDHFNDEFLTDVIRAVTRRLQLLIVMAKSGVNALRVKPAFNLRTALMLGFIVSAVFGCLKVADQVTWKGEEERDALAGNTTAVSVLP